MTSRTDLPRGALRDESHLSAGFMVCAPLQEIARSRYPTAPRGGELCGHVLIPTLTCLFLSDLHRRGNQIIQLSKFCFLTLLSLYIYLLQK